MSVESAWESLTAEERLLAERIRDQQEPLGAAKAHRFLVERGVDVSQATVSRSLLRLDAAGITRAVGRAGRRLTDDGEALLARLSTHRRRNALADAIFIGADRRRLLDLLRLRRSIEVEAVELAIERATDDELDALDASVRAYDQHRDRGDFSRDAIDFHVHLCQATASLPYGLIAEALLPEMDRLEPLLVRASELVHETMRSNADHATIAAAMHARDARRARDAVHEHFSTMITWLEAVDEGALTELTSQLSESLPQK